MTETPTMQEILATLTFFRDSLSLVLVNTGRAFPIPREHHRAKLDAAIRILGSLHCSPGAQIVLGELGYGEAAARQNVKAEPQP